LDTLNIRYQASGFDLSAIPQEGPLVVVANHPFGCVEGVILAHALKQVRPDVKIMVNYLLGRVSELSELFITVDPFGSPKSARKNLGPMKSAVKWLKNNGVLVIFPAWEVASYKPSQRKVVDAKWSDSVARLVEISKSSVLAIYFHGQNSPFFQALGFVRPRNPFQDKTMDKLSANDLGLIRDIEIVSDMVSQMEHDQKGMPILLKQYLKLGGKLLSINVDDQFSDTLDGLIMVDLIQTNQKVLAKYMGKERANTYFIRHQQDNRFSYRDDQTPAA
jgi:putative hemolysin